MENKNLDESGPASMIIPKQFKNIIPHNLGTDYYKNTDLACIWLGLDNSGKTMALYTLKLNEIITTIPTIGFNVETLEQSSGYNFCMWDVGGISKLRPL